MIHILQRTIPVRRPEIARPLRSVPSIRTELFEYEDFHWAAMRPTRSDRSALNQVAEIEKQC